MTDKENTTQHENESLGDRLGRYEAQRAKAERVKEMIPALLQQEPEHCAPPWSSVYYDDAAPEVNDGIGAVIIAPKVFGNGTVQQMANVTLIEASPDLLEAARLALRRFAAYDLDGVEQPTRDECMESLARAVAKAQPPVRDTEQRTD